jgi:hypothetical protein
MEKGASGKLEHCPSLSVMLRVPRWSSAADQVAESTALPRSKCEADTVATAWPGSSTTDSAEARVSMASSRRSVQEKRRMHLIKVVSISNINV